MMAATANLHYVYLGCILALHAAVFAVLSRRASTGFSRALVAFPLVCHLNKPPLVHRDRPETSFDPGGSDGQAIARENIADES
jgi:hypothetical protein